MANACHANITRDNKIAKNSSRNALREAKLINRPTNRVNHLLFVLSALELVPNTSTFHFFFRLFYREFFPISDIVLLLPGGPQLIITFTRFCPHRVDSHVEQNLSFFSLSIRTSFNYTRNVEIAEDGEKCHIRRH